MFATLAFFILMRLKLRTAGFRAVEAGAGTLDSCAGEHADHDGPEFSRFAQSISASAIGQHRAWKLRHILVHVVSPIVLGAAIYTCWRSRSLLVFKWYQWFHVYGPVMALRHAVWPMRHFMPSWVLFSLPDGCWVYAFTAFMAGLWRNYRYEGWAAFWCLLPATLAVGSEIGQAFHVVPGTFDVADLVVYIVAGLLATYFVRRRRSA